MYSIETIKQMNAEACKKARPRLPKMLVRLKSIEDFGKKKIQQIGTGTCEEGIDRDFERIDTLFCDISGWGAPYEPALTQEQLKVKLGEIIAEHGPILVALTEIGLFQGYLGVWGAKRRKRVTTDVVSEGALP